jgi:hypothetical protein
VLAPVRAAIVLPVWRRSWKCRSGTPSLPIAADQSMTLLRLPRQIGRPDGVVKTRASLVVPGERIRSPRDLTCPAAAYEASASRELRNAPTATSPAPAIAIAASMADDT